MKFNDRRCTVKWTVEKKINLIETHLDEFFVPVNLETLFEAKAPFFSKPTLAHEEIFS